MGIGCIASLGVTGSDVSPAPNLTNIFSQVLNRPEPHKCNKLALLPIKLDLFELLDVYLVKLTFITNRWPVNISMLRVGDKPSH